MLFVPTCRLMLTIRSTFFVWETIFSELEKIGEFHNSLSNKIENELCQQITNYIKEKEKTKKKVSPLSIFHSRLTPSVG